MTRWLYVLPIHPDHPGINAKVAGQCEALTQQGPTTLHQRTDSRHSLPVLKIMWTLIFDIKTIILSFSHTHIFYRYNPKSIVSSLWLIILSYFKTVIVEHNTNLSSELRFLQRHAERQLHQFMMQLWRLSHAQHLAVNMELKHSLKDLGIANDYLIYAQNGYSLPSIKTPATLSDHIINLSPHPTKKVAIFCGNGYEWHGLDRILSLIKTREDLELWVVGPYDKNTIAPEYVTFLGALSHDELRHIYPKCHFAISTFAWDRIGITQGSPLKSREYLCMGLPILVNYDDCAADFESLNPFIYNYHRHPEALDEIIHHSLDHREIQQTALKCLSWPSVWSTWLNA